MPTLRESLMPVVDNLRALPQTLGFRTMEVRIRRRVWPGAIGDDSGGPPVDTDLVLSPWPRVKEVTGKDVAASGGTYRTGDLNIGPITPAYSVSGKSGGYTDAQLRPVSTDDHTQIIYVVAGDDYQYVDDITDRAMARWVIVRRKETTP